MRFLMGVGLGAAMMYFLDPVSGLVRQAALQRRLMAGSARDRMLSEHVRGSLSDLTSRPKAIAIATRRGVVTLSGAVLASEVAGVLAGVRRLPGVVDVVNRLDIRGTADVAALREP